MLRHFKWEPETPVCTECGAIFGESEEGYSSDVDWEDAETILCENCYNDKNIYCQGCESLKEDCECDDDE